LATRVIVDICRLASGDESSDPAGNDVATLMEFEADLTRPIREAGSKPDLLLGFGDRDETGAALAFSGCVPG
jgi:hypothetical protein